MAFQSASLLPGGRRSTTVLLPLEIVEPLPLDFRSASARSAPARRGCCKRRARRLRRQVPVAAVGGMQQRASICRALIHEPKMLLARRAFGALDAFTREELWCILRDLWTRSAST
jgi:NitT/TauT family transport system ATP-binding protein